MTSISYHDVKCVSHHATSSASADSLCFDEKTFCTSVRTAGFFKGGMGSRAKTGMAAMQMAFPAMRSFAHTG